MQLVNIGFGNIVSANRIIAIVSPESAPIKRMVQEAKDKGTAIDATYGRRTRAVVITDSDHLILSALQPETAVVATIMIVVTLIVVKTINFLASRLDKNIENN